MAEDIYLIPGFFGFASFGDFKYFAHVRDLLNQHLVDPDSVRIHYVRTRPTAGLRRRAARLLDTIAETAEGDGPIHLIGHSTGGIDARLLTAPGARLPTDTPLEPLARRVASVVTIATPHHGAPIARAFTTARGQHLLRFLSAMTVHVVRLSSVPVGPIARLVDGLSGGRLADLPAGLLDSVYRDVLMDFDGAQREQLSAFFAEVAEDQALLAQLTPGAMADFASELMPRDGVRYGSVVTRARPPADPTLGGRRGPSYALYRLLHRLSQPLPSDPRLTARGEWEDELLAAFGELPHVGCNDAFVPTLSQLNGDLVHATWADHLDVIGHFSDPTHNPPHVDWLLSGTSFQRSGFEALWTSVADYLQIGTIV